MRKAASLLDLVPHPQAPRGPVRSVQAGVARSPRGRLAVRYRIECDLERLCLPAPRTPAPGERLWQHTCCEIFVARAGMLPYREFNFSPSGEWAAYACRRYRECAPFSIEDPEISLTRSPDGLELQASIPADDGGLRVALSAVIEDRAGSLTYWALRHPAGKPDFHHPDAFALELD